MSNTTKQAIISLAYYLRNQKLYSWNAIIKILNYKHDRPNFIRMVKQFAKLNNLDPPISYSSHKDAFLTYNLYVLGMPLKDISRFQDFSPARAYSIIYERLNAISKMYLVPYPPLYKKKTLHQYPAPTLNPQPLWITSPSKIRLFNSHALSRFSRLSDPPLYSLYSTPQSFSNKQNETLERLPTAIRHIIKNNPLQLLSPLDRVILTLNLIVTHKQEPRSISKALGYNRFFDFIYCLNHQLSKTEHPDLHLSHTDFISLPLNKTHNTKD